ncbi:peroxisomal membrane protein (Pex13) [Drepanopeziza brunnea f. sp. 'multigermtubi' MB_m1]|uniref:Peroxisomal membrane protein PEX13 n=1 Tax=Marssonina brunnea f. sp. multigermtubi (strain MB_m1) TaxID=1072389 RepID=K1WZX2_MARBU|nr:peroxisomal membrane protein (Pex13) [Drepanopeziza brunnea f. sp. 'multigermtubi' MB_m1]EKD18217.1 peroxisomal membrane protein (Pex13) [Drepanopeziza brunnea f. sp. 'multigermtubi' MB_m1]
MNNRLSRDKAFDLPGSTHVNQLGRGFNLGQRFPIEYFHNLPDPAETLIIICFPIFKSTTNRILYSNSKAHIEQYIHDSRYRLALLHYPEDKPTTQLVEALKAEESCEGERMATVSPPKPWERAGAGGVGSTETCADGGQLAAVGSSAGSVIGNPVTDPLSTGAPGAPAVPERPSSLTSAVNRNASAYSPYNANRMGGVASPFGGMGSAYSSPYSRMGGMGGMGYGGYGSSMYGGMGGMGGIGGMYGGMGGGMYGGMGGMQGDPNDPNSLTNGFTQNTQATFQIIEGIVGAFGGFAQMLESTYMATHSSFYALLTAAAMVSVAEQFGNLRNTLGSILGIFTLMRWLRTLFARITGRPPPADAMALTPSAFASFEGRKFHPDGSPAQTPRPSKKPFIFFLAAAFGLPYLMGKLIKALAASQEEEQRRLAASGQMQIGPDGQPIPVQIDPSKLDFCRVLYDFTPEAGAAVQGIDLEVKKGDLVAVLSKSDPMGNPSEWWRCRARDGRMGYLPGVYLEVAKRPGMPVAEIKSASQSGSRTNSITSQTKAPAVPAGKAGDMSVESFQKSQFYS